jgi:acyl-homoserine-lactone acylase
MTHPHATARAPLFRVLAIVGVLGAITAGALLAVSAATGRDHRYETTIRRTAYGIPHILARDYGSLGYGYGYAYAQDNLCLLADRVLTLRGRRSRYLGPAAAPNDPFADEESANTNLASDVYYRGLRASRLVQRLLARPAPLGPTAELREMVDGYVAGYNRYLHKTGVAHLPDPTCRGKAWVSPITALDVWSGMYDLTTAEGTRRFMGAIVGARPPAASGRARPSASPVASGRRDGTGSNGWALGRDATRDRDGMLLANPHFPWAGFARFYQVQLTIPGVLDVAGASLAGTPVVEIGHTHGVAWTHTTSTARRFTLFQLHLVPGKPTSYLVDGRRLAMSRQAVTVTVRGAGGKLSTVRRTLYRTRYGPVLADGWTAKTAFALRDVNADNLRAMTEWLAMGKAQTLAQLRAAQDTYQGIPFTNTIAVDARGTAYFADASAVPNVTDAHAARCIDTPEGKQRYPEIFVLDGSKSACNWGNDAGAIERGIFAPGHLPRLTRTDYVANSNRSPWLTNPAAPLTGYPAIFGDTRTDRELRTRLGLDMIAKRLAGTDSLGRPGFTLPTLQESMLGNRNYAADLGRTEVVAMCRAHPILTASNGARVDVRAACRLLARWNGRADAGSRGEELWEAFFRPTETWWRTPFDPAHPLSSPRGIDTRSPDVRRALADAARFLHNDPAARRGKRWAGITLPGCPDEKGCFNVVEDTRVTGPQAGPPPGQGGPTPRPVPRRAGPTRPAVFGSSFIMAVELTPHGPRARTILTYSQSANPASPHYRDQTHLFSRKQWVSERFTETQISTDPQLRTTNLRS